MNRFAPFALALALIAPTASFAQDGADDIPIVAPSGSSQRSGADEQRMRQGDSFDFESNYPGSGEPSRQQPRLGSSSSPDFDDLNTSGGERPVRREAATPTGLDGPPASSGGDVSAIEAELIRIELDLKNLEEDIRTYRELAATSRDGSERQRIEQMLYSFDAQRRALIASARQLQGARQRAGGPQAPDGSLAGRTFEQERERRLKGEADNPLSPESTVGETIEDVVGARDVVREQAIQRWIESLEDEELKARVEQLYSASRLDKSMQKPLETLIAAINAAGGKSAKLSDPKVKKALEDAEAEAKRKGVDSDQLVALFMAKAGRDAIPLEERVKYVKVLIDFDSKHANSEKPLVPELKAALDKAKADYVAYGNAEKKFLENQSDTRAREQAEAAFQTHLQSLKKFLKVLDDVTKQGQNEDGIYASNTSASPAAATDGPVLQRRSADDPLPVPEDTTSTATAEPAPVSPTAAAATSTTPAPTHSNPEALAKVEKALVAFNEATLVKMKEIDGKMVSSWSKERPWSITFWKDDPRVEQLREFSKHYFVWGTTNTTGHVNNVWPVQLRNIYSEAYAAGIDIDKEESLKRERTFARFSALGSILLAKMLHNYDGHLKTIEDAADVDMAMFNMHMTRLPVPRMLLFNFQREVEKETPNIKLGIEGLWTSTALADAKALLLEAVKAERGGTVPTAKLEDLRVAFHHHKQRMSRGYISRAGGTARWMSVADSPVYRLVELINYFLENKKWFEAKLAMDELH